MKSLIIVVVQACVITSVESVVESWISVLEHHANKSRNLSYESIQHELMIALNGPLSQHCTPVVEEAMRAYWGRLKNAKLRNGHFTRVSD